MKHEKVKIRAGRPDDAETLLSLWERSVRATHAFLGEEDILGLQPLVRQALATSETWVAERESAPLGFMLLDNNKIEALFVKPGARGRGVGTALLEHAFSLRPAGTAWKVDVNEQNPAALACYEARGFRGIGRSSVDGQGRLFPLLHLLRAAKPETGVSHPEADKLWRRLAGVCDDATATGIAYGVPLPREATDAEKAVWVRHIVDGMDRHFDPDTIKTVRMGCHCDEEGWLSEMKTWLRGLYEAAAGLEEFVAKVNAHGAGWYIEDGALYTKFLSCECYMLQGVDRLPSTSWCQCTVGYTKNLFEHVFGCGVESELVQSLKMGHPFCVVKITPEDPPRAGSRPR